MADADNKKEQKDIKNETKTDKSTESKPASAKIGIITWAILAVIVIICAGSGFFLGRLFAGPSSPEQVKSPEENTQAAKPAPDNSQTGSEDTWYYNDLESIVVNPDEPGATRFVRVGLILEISSDISQEKAKKLIESQKPPLVNWLNLYFKSLTLDEMKNDKDMKRIQLQICDAFNEILFPDAKPQIKKILIREFNVQ